MSLAIVYSRANSGIHAALVTVEAHISKGFPTFNIVGLAETAVKESRDRVRSALINANFEFPRKRITINLAPADLPKEGGRFDLPIALGILAASQQISKEALQQFEFAGELALSGDLRYVHGVLPLVLAAKEASRTLIIPQWNEQEASIVKDAQVLVAKDLLSVCEHLQKKKSLSAAQHDIIPVFESVNDLSDVRGQPVAKRALEIAAAGQHSLLLIGPPGTGKTMLASRLPGILPQISEQAALEVAALASLSSQGFDCKAWQKLPFRAPHHTTSSVALVGGGRPPRPGEISLAHLGVLFLDELPEFNRQVLETLREPLESGQITISRAAYQAIYPAQFQLIAAMNPCPCGYAANDDTRCHCTEDKIQRYLGKLSGPLLDRIDMHVLVGKQNTEILSANSAISEDSATVRARVARAREFQIQRQQKTNAHLSVKELNQWCELNTASLKLLNQIMKKFDLSARVYHRIIKLARTIADLELSQSITQDHLCEALNYRHLDRTRASSGGIVCF